MPSGETGGFLSRKLYKQLHVDDFANATAPNRVDQARRSSGWFVEPSVQGNG